MGQQSDTTKVVGYVRVSTDEQTVSGLGLEAQRGALRAFADLKGWHLAAVHIDAGVSGSKEVNHRPGLLAALADVESGTASVIVVSKVDRLSRSLHTLTSLMSRADRAGWALAAVDGTVDMSTPASRFTTQIMGSVAELERAMISQRTKDALAVRKAQGVRLGRPASLPKDVVARIVNAKRDGHSLRAIAAALEDDRVVTARGGRVWHASSVKAVLDGQDAAKMLARTAP